MDIKFPTVTGLPATASININGTVGATTPSTVAATTAQIGNGTISSDIVFHVQKGTALTQPTWNVNDVAVFANESGSNTVVNILSSNAAIGQLVFSDTDARAVAAVAYNHSNDTMSLNVNGGATVCAISSTGLAVTGEITATGNITAYYSDDRLKTKLGNIENALDKVLSLDGFYYEANETAQALGYTPVREVGLSAQSVQKVLPEVIAPAPIDPQYLTMHYERVVPLLVEAIKELKAEVELLKK